MEMNATRFSPSATGEPINYARRGEKRQYSGFVIVRLAKEFAGAQAGTLMDVAREHELRGLAAILDEYDLERAQPVVRSLPPEEILKLESTAARSALPPLHSLTTYWRLDLRKRWDDAEKVVAQLNELHEVDRAYRELAVSEPVVNATDDDYAAAQNYLDAAPTGIDARWAWTQANGEGAGVGVVDVEQGWFLNHEDLSAKAPTLIYGDNKDGVGTYKGDHGTAVLGEILAEDNTVGVVGIAPGCTWVRVASHYDAGTNTNLHVADAIVASIPVMALGDVMLLEIQRAFLPTETDDADFDAIRLAVAHGRIVVEAAGNGNEDLDAYTDAGAHILDRNHNDFRESGAIMVGAAESAAAHDRWQWSNYGSRIDCYGWGENIVTCGYGYLDSGTGDNSTYTDTFGGTSGASPMIVGAALILQGMYEATTGTRLSPGQMRALLSDPATGTAQGAGRPGNINVMPDLRAIIKDVLELVPDVYLRDQVGDTGALPSAANISASPDIIVRPVQVADPVLEFGEGSGNENSDTLGSLVYGGQDNHIYVRMKNRGSSDAAGVVATVYWSEVATLITPDQWHEIGQTAPVDVPQGDTLVVAGPVKWPEAEVPGDGHYCFVGLLDQAEDPAPPLPPGPPHFDWNAFLSFIRDHNNVTWRNFDVETDPLGPGDPLAIPFLIANAPDDCERSFDFEILRALPRDVEVWLELPLLLAMKVARNQQWKLEVDRERHVGALLLPGLPRVALKQVSLGPAVRYHCRFLLRAPRRIKPSNYRLAIRQIWEGMEMGRVTRVFQGERISRPL